MSEEIIVLKEQAEKALLEFKQCAKAITDQGFTIRVNYNDTLYVFREKTEKITQDTGGTKEITERESYGEFLQPPKPPTPVRLDPNANATPLQ